MKDYDLLDEYRSHKIVKAAKVKGIEIHKDGSATIATDNEYVPVIKTKPEYKERFKGDENELGYYVRYKDGYESWSPTKAFEEGYKLAHVCGASNLTFGQAIEALKSGKRVAREGWNGKNMFLFLLPAGTIPTKAIHDPSLREVIESEVGGDIFEALGSIRMFTADKKILTGWLASQTDMLSEDWMVLN